MIRKGRGIYVDINIFDKIDSEEKAYWLGFIYADGNISDANKIYEKNKKRVYRIEISLKESDREHLEKLKVFLKYEGKIRIEKTNFPRSNRCRLYFNCKDIWFKLNSYGCTPKKSLTLTFPNISIFEDMSLIRHFIRGYIDGDGCISYISKIYKDKQRMSLSINGTASFLNSLQDNLILERKNKIHKDKRNNVYTLTFNDWRGYYICNYIYQNATIFLNRKYEKYLEYCRLYK